MDATDLAGWKSGKLRVKARAENTERGATRWLCQCECGNYRIVRADLLLQGKVSRCTICALTPTRNIRLAVWTYPVIDHSYGPRQGYAGFARVWRGENELDHPQWISYQPAARRGGHPSVLTETVRRLSVRGALALDARPQAITRWLTRHRDRTEYHMYPDGHEVWAAWLSLTGEWRGPAHLLA